MKTVIRLFFALLCILGAGPKAQAVDPPPGGGYPDGNTAVGTEALLDLTTGQDNLLSVSEPSLTIRKATLTPPLALPR
jgi:hypothetical protein